jgi:hypothetical protein
VGEFFLDKGRRDERRPSFLQAGIFEGWKTIALLTRVMVDKGTDAS